MLRRFTQLVLGTMVLVLSLSANAKVIYSITFDGLLHNDGFGAWGGDLMVGADQAINLTLEYHYSEYPFHIESGFSHRDGDASFALLGMRLFDNTNGLSSDFLIPDGGVSTIAYNHRFQSEQDWFTMSSIEYPVGGFLHPSFPAPEFFFELGEPGDRFPYGTEFDAFINRSEIYLLFVAGTNLSLDPGSGLYNHVNSLVGPRETLQPGDFTFSSRLIPIPSSAALFALGLFCLFFRARLRL